MTPEHAKELLPIITAFANGEEVQYKNTRGQWDIPDEYGLSFIERPDYYRIAPKPRKFWVNEYQGFPSMSSVGFHPTKKEADEAAGSNRVACYELEFPPLP
jgi:hypothetical protein